MRKITIESRSTGWLAHGACPNTLLRDSKQLHTFINEQRARGFNCKFMCAPR